MNGNFIRELQDKAELYDLWEVVHQQTDNLYDFDNTLSADQLKDGLREIISLESFGAN